MISFKPTFYQALEEIYGVENNLKLGGGSSNGPLSEIIFNDETGKPTDEEVNIKLASMIKDWEAQEYARNRQDDYPDWGTQLEKIYDDGLTKWKSEMVDPVKTKWPKDNSGPK